MPTSPVTYRVSPEVDAELKRLAGKHGGVDKALRVLLAMQQSQAEAASVMERTGDPWKASEAAISSRPFRPPPLKPKDVKSYE